jgi:hypothetical protein
MDEIQQALKERYSGLHPLLFHRCFEKAKSHSELFDMLDSIPTECPIIWDEKTRAWILTDLLQQQLLLKEEKT